MHLRRESNEDEEQRENMLKSILPLLSASERTKKKLPQAGEPKPDLIPIEM